jgi:hypothetical protein
MGGSSGGTQTVGPPKYQLPYLQRGLEEAEGIYNTQRGGQNVVPLSPETNQSLDMAANRARGGSPVVGAAQDLATKTLQGGFMGANPYLDATFNRAALQTQNQLASQFAGSNRNIGASEGLRSQQLNDLATGIYGGAYDSERNRMQDALGAAIPLANQDYVDAGQLGQVGAAREGFAQEQMDAPGLALDNFLGRVGAPMGQTSVMNPARNRAAGAIGGGMLGSQFANQMGYGGWGQAAGGLLGAGIGGWL